ncbi:MULTISPECIES: ABC transporter ATP-binding protein [unclassified Roseofilum]|uniref:ABC transporter ATP-binding protein n=1 Tax=unclassified Roseofilum TaxID=2620099 RepID=UPI000E9BEDCB|nr:MULTISPECIES: ABC transporter ATP-binding protein [unclassified Roseofilum]MBP0007340.1 ABC transporter ATP-binding protein [Roseofilum sp. Belize Diploria]MBP0034877.1 ABC transporter ATP-binding protein [Roseofilum sp. Belize BBD 4]HBQ99613.1 ABC transporter ATP-binding protein [Cyanobacteria bacterium UBA11691]
MSETVVLNLEEVSKQFDPKRGFVVNQVSFALKEGDILGLVGPSGCGKTTLLRLIAGFEQPVGGKIELRRQEVGTARFSVPPEKRDVGIVFQDYALFPHLTVAENIIFGLKHRRGSGTGTVEKRLLEALSLVSLEGLQNRYPHQLSGGQQQRVALARALAPEPTIVLLDEPLSNLDIQVRVRLRSEIRRILKASGISAIFVTHDQEEALSICDGVGVMHNGQLEQIGPPEIIYRHPQTRFVAEFVTQANFIPARRNGSQWDTEIGSFFVPDSEDLEQGDLMIREEDIQLKPDENAIAKIGDRQFLGREHRYTLHTSSGLELKARSNTINPLPIGTKVNLQVRAKTWQIFPTIGR